MTHGGADELGSSRPPSSSHPVLPKMGRARGQSVLPKANPTRARGGGGPERRGLSITLPTVSAPGGQPVILPPPEGHPRGKMGRLPLRWLTGAGRAWVVQGESCHLPYKRIWKLRFWSGAKGLGGGWLAVTSRGGAGEQGLVGIAGPRGGSHPKKWGRRGRPAPCRRARGALRRVQ